MPFFKLNETAPKALLQVVDTAGALVTAGVAYNTAGLTIYIQPERGTLIIYGVGGSSLIQSTDPAGTHQAGKVYNGGGGVIQFDLPTSVASSATQQNVLVWGKYTGGELIAVPGLVGGGVGGLPVLDANGRVASNVTAMASDALDSIDASDPGGVATTFPQMVVQIWRRFFKRVTKDSDEIKTYADDGTTVRTTQTYTSSGADDDVGAAS